VVICLEQGADLHMSQLMPLPLTVSCFSKIQTGFTFLVLAHLGSPRNRAGKRVCVLMSVISNVANLMRQGGNAADHVVGIFQQISAQVIPDSSSKTITKITSYSTHLLSKKHQLNRRQ